MNSRTSTSISPSRPQVRQGRVPRARHTRPFRRGTALAALLAAPALVLPVLAPPAQAAAPSARPVAVAGATHTLLLRGADTAAARTPVAGPGRTAVLTAPSATAPFALLGVSWDDPAVHPFLAVTVRTKSRSGWGPWRPLRLDGDSAGQYAEDAARSAAARGASEPLWVGRSDGVQARVSVLGGELPAGLRLELVDPGRSAADAAVPRGPGPVVPGDDTPVARPVIVSRAEWGADESLRDRDFKYTNTVKVMFVHHTADSNEFTCADSPAVLRSIYRYHVKTNGWADIGYNFLVDRCGTIYEGRAGGVDQPVKGAHTLGFNTDTAAVAAMGTYSDTPAPDALIDGLARVIAWKLSLYGRDPLGQDQLTSGDSGSRFPAGTNVRFNVVSGHRDAFATECPGQRLYDDLSRLRRGAQRAMGL
ncbi:peptidoglycan recognition protein family protein [Yinghuangia seranimata]|uniref:peptidoglycan recognition protein family protein n=1 Tax=Yinghuangia seranimata TaxID=408067 RepID=UPI00248C1068|nr:peptidoglycan recognition protein [Yinghuangia seranimata]MDI2132248.1 peptidoglycan recognition protein [Yinghuangia seranimata]